MSAQTCTIAVDIGTTTLKAVAFRDRDGGEIAQAQAAAALWTDETGAAEQDAPAVYDAVTGILARLAGQVRESGCGVARVGLSAAMHSLLPVGLDGRPLSRALIWMDTRARTEAEALWSSAEGRDCYARTGAPIHPMTPMAKLLWLARHRPDLMRRAARFVSLKEWVWHGWFGNWRVDASIAGAAGLYGLRTGDWDVGALALAGISADRLSQVVPTTFIGRGLREPRLLAAGLHPETPFVIGASDGVLANLGVGAIGHERLVLTIGTSLAARVGSAEPVTDPDTRSFCYVLADGRFIVGGPSNSGGILLDWLANKVLTPPDRDDGGSLGALVAAAGSVETGALLCLPYVAGERAPLWDAAARAAFIGLDINHGRPHLMRAAVEGMILNARWIVAGLLERIGRPEEIVATGNPFRQAWIRQLTADVFGIPVRHRSDVDASLRGAAMLARIATGAADWTEAAGAAAAEDTVAAPSDTARYAGKYERFRRLAAAVANPGPPPDPDGSAHPGRDAEEALPRL